MLERLEALEADVRFLCTELGAEKLLWSSRFLELLQEQQGLRQRLQERPRRWDSGDSPELLGEAEDQSASGSEGESLAGSSWGHGGDGEPVVREGGPATCSQSWGWGNMLRSANREHWEVPGRTGCQGRLPGLCTSCQQEPGWVLLHSAELRPSLRLSPFCSVKGHRWMEPRWQPAPCPGSLLGPAAPRQAEGVSGVLVRREGATCPSLPRHCRT
ncbi:PREDICTED: uncharacterized protein LOC104837085 [Haliaeetus leucocephalus]|uniref:uncharacterized protein LOC104837085 n=1 Tax=Haliaeetus leucocephalus TaxID=52644 RepID=UPI00053CB2B1|nr:PREDICTED: uncharacterized protein LOC104837085 [Haliaeetus leucocephalus]